MIAIPIFLSMFFVPIVIGAVAGMILSKVRSDLLALLTSLVIIVLFQILVSTDFPKPNLFSPDISDKRILALAVFSSISTALMIPYILCRWGVELGDHFRYKHKERIRHNSKGNVVLFSLFLFSCISTIVQGTHHARSSYPELSREYKSDINKTEPIK